MDHLLKKWILKRSSRWRCFVPSILENVNQFRMENINQTIILNNKGFIPGFNRDRRQLHFMKRWTGNESNTAWNFNRLKWWPWKCIWFNLCQSWIWFKCDWWKWFAFVETFWSKNFNISRNYNWLKWWIIKCFRFNSCQAWIWFKCDWWKWFTTWKTIRTKNFNTAADLKFWWSWNISNQFVMDNVN
jgi:hypothetical protein